MRKLVTIQKIKAIVPIHGADFLEKATVLGWDVVVKKGQFKVGDPCVYFEIDSFLPIQPQYEFLRKGCYKNTENLGEGFRLRTIKLRKQISQGLIMPIEELGIYKESDTTWKYTNSIGNQYYIHPELEEDLSEILEVKKYEKPIPASLRGKMEGNFPSFIRKTDQERVQNIIEKDAEEIYNGHFFEVTLKLHGTSWTGFKIDNPDHHLDETSPNYKVGVCSRNYELKLDDPSSAYVKFAQETGILDMIPSGYAVQGELYGNGIEGNRDKLPDIQLFIFDVWNITEQRYLTPKERHQFYKDNFVHPRTREDERKDMSKNSRIHHIPVIEYNYGLGGSEDYGTEYPHPRMNLADILLFAEEEKSIHPDTCAEGIVFKRMDGKYSFKVISNKFELEQE